MRNLKKSITAAVCILMVLCSVISIPMQAMAATMGDVIAKAREIGMPESEINSYIAQYGGTTYTSEQYQQAINALEGMRDKYSGSSSSETTSETETETETVSETETNEYTEKINEFFDKSSEEKIQAILEMSDDDATGFWNALTDEQQQSVKEVLNADDVDDLKDSAEKAAAELGLTTKETTTEETATEESTSEATTEAEETLESVEAVKNTTNIVIWCVAGVIVAVVVVFLIIAAILKKKSSKKD